jgi:glycine betaine/proline transport system substrate-binding protein
VNRDGAGLARLFRKPDASPQARSWCQVEDNPRLHAGALWIEKQGERTMQKSLLFGMVLAFAGLAAVGAEAADPAACRTVRMSDVGWSDNIVINGLASYVLSGLGYEPKETMLSVPVTYEALKTKKIDVFLDNWMPTMTENITPYVKNKTVEVVRADLTNAKYTLAVPAYLYGQGLHSFQDVAKFREQLDGKIYGIEPGNDGNRLILDMIKKDQFGLKGFQLIESSEQGMLAEVKRKVAQKKPIVFLGWEPHPMNTQFDMKYLSGGDAVFGGDSTVYSNVRAGYLQECPNVGKFLKNLVFSLQMENLLMGDVMYKKMHPEAAAAGYLKAHPEVLKTWLDGVTTFDGKPGLPAVMQRLGA